MPWVEDRLFRSVSSIDFRNICIKMYKNSAYASERTFMHGRERMIFERRRERGEIEIYVRIFVALVR
jgi:hypothetical protein